MLSPYEKKIVERLVAAFSSIEELQRIVVFGSRARGASQERSDLDILLILNNEKPSLLFRIQELKEEALPDLEDFFYVSVIPISLEKYESGDLSFKANIERDGEVLWKRT